jgi:hypothetical protein
MCTRNHRASVEGSVCQKISTFSRAIADGSVMKKGEPESRFVHGDYKVVFSVFFIQNQRPKQYL